MKIAGLKLKRVEASFWKFSNSPMLARSPPRLKTTPSQHFLEWAVCWSQQEFKSRIPQVEEAQLGLCPCREPPQRACQLLQVPRRYPLQGVLPGQGEEGG